MGQPLIVSHWHQLAEGTQCSPKDFYTAAVEGLKLRYLDYGCDIPDTHLLCATNARWPEDAPVVGADGKSQYDDKQGISKCLCECLRRQVPQQFGGPCEYNAFGLPPRSNSNGGLNSAVSGCEALCKEMLNRPGWLNDANFPGWDNKPKWPTAPGSGVLP